jgi:putative CocE/NonD family hydrolase
MLDRELKPVEIDPRFQFELEARRAVLPPPVCGTGGYFIEEVEMRDGIMLITKVIVPDTGDQWPTLFMRTPYPMFWAMAATTDIALVEQGYCVVIQSCRGTNGSGGLYEPFENERDDGIDGLQWLAKQSWHDGNIATYGMSYMCYTQWIVANHLPPEVKTMYLDCFGIDRYSQVYMNGMFRHDIYTSWALTNCEVEFDDLDETYEEALTIRPHNIMDERLVGKKLPFYQNQISQIARSDPYWKDGFWEVLRHIPAKINVPVCIAEGWLDHNVEGVMVGIKGLRPEIRKQSKVMIGPWDHSGSFPGELEYPDAKKHGPVHVALMVEWFDRMLKGKDKDEPITSEVYVLGEGAWHTIDTWPPETETVAYYLGDGGALATSPTESSSISYEYDPDNPVKTVGGNALMAWMGGLGDTDRGPQLQPDYSERDDVLTFKSDSLDEAMTLMGGVEVYLEVATTAPDTSFMVKLSEEFADGRTLNIVDGASSILLRNESESLLDYTPNERVVLKIRLWDTAWQVQKGSRLRLDVTSSNFPMYHIHPNRAGVWSTYEDWDKAEQTVYFGSENSAVYLPVWKGEKA